jgi:hypothetical protein
LPAAVTVSGIANPSSGVYPLTVTAAGNGVGPAVPRTFTVTVVGPPVFTTGSSVQFLAGTTSAFNIATVPGLPAKVTVTEKGKLPAGVRFRAGPGGTAKLTGKPIARAAGTYSITLITSSGVFSQSQTFTLSVEGAPVFTGPRSALIAVGQTTGLPVFKAIDLPVATYSVSGSLPAGLGFVDNGDGTAQLIGAAQETGTFTLTITATNSYGPAQEVFALNVGQAASITSAGTATFTAGQVGTFRVTTTSTGTSKIVLSEKGKLPAGVTIHNNGDGTATLGGKPAGSQAGVYSFTITAKQGALSTTQAFTLTVNPALQAPTFTSGGTATFVVGQAGSFQIATTAAGGGNVTVTEKGKLPKGVTVKPGAGGTATLSGTPAVKTGGVYHLTLSARDSAGSTTQALTLLVDQAPAIAGAVATTFAVGQAGSFRIKTAGFPAPSFSVTGNLPPGVTLVDNHDGTATLTGTPPPGSGGTYSFTITATNGMGSDSKSFVMTVRQSPVFTNFNTATFTAGSQGSFTITTTGTPTAKLTWKGKLPRGLKVVDNHDGTATLSGKLAKSVKKGAYVIFITANNGVGPAAIQRLTVAVTG